VLLYCCAFVPQVCYYRDKNSINKFTIAKVSAEGVTISGAWLAPALPASLLPR
jgi:hypothetical protein